MPVQVVVGWAAPVVRVVIVFDCLAISTNGGVALLLRWLAAALGSGATAELRHRRKGNWTSDSRKAVGQRRHVVER